MSARSRSVTPRDLGIPETFPLPMRTDWRIGLVGFGRIAAAHVPAYRSAGWKIVAAADPDDGARARAQEAGVGRVYTGYEELIADADVEVISLLTHPTIREPVVRAAARAGKPILTEKPLARDIEECERLAAIADEAGIPFAVSQNYRWAGTNFFAHHIVRKGLIGTPFFGRIEIQGTQDVELADHPFYSRCDDFLTVQWNNHLADLLRYWSGRDAQRVLACTRRMTDQNFISDNMLLSIVDFGQGLTGLIVHSELLRSPMRSSQCRLDGDEGSVVFALSGGHLELASKQLGPEVYTLDLTGIELPSSFAGPMGDLLLSVEQGREPATSARRNLATMRQVFAEHRSALNGGLWTEV